MKRCSTCNRTYTDPNLSFCIDDGTPLTTVTAEDESTVVSPRARDTSSDSEWKAAPYQPPGTYVPPGTKPKRRRVWPWLVGLGAAFLLGIFAISLAALFLTPRLLRPAERGIAVENRNSNQSSNSNAGEPPNRDSNADVAVDTPPPADHEQVLVQLTDLEHEWTTANFNADKRKLSRILADDYVGSDEKNRPQSKAEYLRSVERESQIERWEFKDLSLLLTGDRATLTGEVTFFLGDRSAKYDFKDKFVWREGRWQATGSEVTRKQ